MLCLDMRKKETIFQERMCWMRWSMTAVYEADTLPTKLHVPRPVSAELLFSSIFDCIYNWQMFSQLTEIVNAAFLFG